MSKFDTLFKTIMENAQITNNLMLPEEIPAELYHATFKQRLRGIKKLGLGANKRKLWSDSKLGVVYLARK
jgi:hypothetical protein